MNLKRHCTTQIGLALTAAMALGFSAVSFAQLDDQSVGALESDVRRLEGEMGRIESLWAGPIDLTTQAGMDERLSQGELYFLLKMYEQASLSLYGAISPPDALRPVDAELLKQPGYVDGIYQLAESLYELRNYTGARIYFEQLLQVEGHSYQARAITALMDIGTRLRDNSKLQSYYAQYSALAPDGIPGEVRYLYGKALLLTGLGDAAATELTQIPSGDTHYLRAQYILGAALVRQAGERGSTGEYSRKQREKLEEALAIFTGVTQTPPVATEDKEVVELAHLARGRLYYELDQLQEALDAYQYVSWDSTQLETMLYEATWTYVRRGQMALADESLTNVEREAKAQDEYQLALQQLADLQALEPEGERGAEIELLAGNLRMQRAEFGEADKIFSTLSERWGPIDEQLSGIMDDPKSRDRVLDDILAMEDGALSVESALPPLAARRAAEDADVQDAIRVFRDIHNGRQEIQSTEKMLEKLESLISSENRAERFPQLRTMLSRSLTLENNIGLARAKASDLLSGAAGDLSPAIQQRLKNLQEQRRSLQQKVSSLPTSGAALQKRSDAFTAGYQKLDQSLHEKTLVLNGMRAQLNALDTFFSGADRNSSTAPQAMQNTKRQLQELSSVVVALEEESQAIRKELDTVRTGTTLSGGQGSGEQDLRDRLQRVIEAETALLSQVGGPSADEVRKLDAQAMELRERNQEFLDRLYRTVDDHVASIQKVIDEERKNLARYATQIDAVSNEAEAVRAGAATEALEHVREKLHDIVVRSDVGVIDVAFARKQRETEKIGRLQRAKSKELTELNQAYADLTRDEAQ